ncbi:MAG: lysophospholipid acyltransferase family protein [Nitrospinales bacterium]
MKHPILKQIRHRLEYGAFLCFLLLVSPLSARGVFRLGRLLGGLVYAAGRQRKRIAAINLDIAFGNNKTRTEKKRIARESFRQQAVSLLQCLWLRHRPAERLGELIDGAPEGVDVLRDCLARKKGVLLLTAHYGNWEVMGHCHGSLGIAPLVSVARKLDNPLLEKNAGEFRALFGNAIVHKDESPLKMTRALKNNHCVIVMMDQNMARDGVFVDFFGKPAATTDSIPRLSLATGAAIVPLFALPNREGRYKIRYGPEIKYKTTGDKKADALTLTRQCEQFIESVIRERPEPWMWGHRRWKTRPPEEHAPPVYPG